MGEPVLPLLGITQHQLPGEVLSRGASLVGATAGNPLTICQAAGLSVTIFLFLLR